MAETGLPISGTTKVFGCLAHPTSHVRAPTLFNAYFAKANIDAVMVPVDVAPDGLEAAIKGLLHTPNFHGAAVTIPHKMALADLCDELGVVAKITGAVNAVRLQDGRLYGDNFDGAGFVKGLIDQGHSLADKSVLMIGAGGASRAIAYALAGEPIAKMAVYNRTSQKAEELVTLVEAYRKTGKISVTDSPNPAGFDIIINATSLGLKAGDDMPCDLSLADRSALICDIIMIPEQTAWLIAAQDQGLACHFGRYMLDSQFDLIGHFIGAMADSTE
ncbi:MAG: shikimate dehydrogenase family protein [Candidatus Puniceispirillaceae bacterium]